MKEYTRFRRYALGNVVKKAKVNNRELEIFLTEIKSNLITKYTDGVEIVQPTGQTGLLGDVKDKDGNVLTSNTKRGAKIKAMWLRGSGNRSTPPTVHIGETVEVYKLGNSDKYYWRTLFEEPHIRGKELAMYSYSNIDRDAFPKEMMNNENTYYMLISPLTKEIRLHTSINDKEPLMWDMVLNTKDGTFDLFNDAGDKIHIEKEKIEITSKTINLLADDINIKGKKTVNIETKQATIKGGKLNVKSKTTFDAMVTFNQMTNFNAKANVNSMASVSYHSVVV